MRATAIVAMSACILSCAGLPRIHPAGISDTADLTKKIMTPFLKGSWRVVHSIQGTLPGGSTADMIGVTMASSDTGKIHSTLMSIEGLVLLDAEYETRLVINRGIGPLGRQDLVKGMMRDIRLILFAPKGAMAEAGTLENGNHAGRFRTDEGDILIIMKEGGDIELRAYDRSSRLLRTVRFMDLKPDTLPKKIELESAGMIGYSLRLDLIEAEKIR
ncbi:MAG TPA: hypothetical protein PLM53_09195 [Spirochaetota bacterium]|nr:hypothetical protein [Spirochaetota bacterium]HPC40097.1 hypothetical protein [Spirochaetota bacterium]HPL15855.1 hypothetical protein [Spirochaetota bacterium]HQF08501.1 hypothetical protein [Spirochaetota bacterium]HQH97262.1 hypothetical protein [Spirochaetota bacterium]